MPNEAATLVDGGMPATRSGPTFVFGIGAQKAGTTWLHDWLSGLPEVHCPSLIAGDPNMKVKEVHYFDAISGCGGTAVRMERPAKRVSKILTLLRDPTQSDRAQLVEEAQSLIAMHSVYHGPLGRGEAYRDWMMRGYAGQSIVLDVTPSYALLNRETMKILASVVEQTRAIFLMRDPVDRQWSATRFVLRRAKKPLRQEEFERRARKNFEKFLDSADESAVKRWDYRHTIQTVQSVFDPDAVFYAFYEDLFSQGTLDRLSAFLRIKAEMPDLERRVNVSKPAELEPDLARRAYKFLEPQYQFVADRFGEALPARWRARMDGQGVLNEGNGA